MTVTDNQQDLLVVGRLTANRLIKTRREATQTGERPCFGWSPIDRLSHIGRGGHQGRSAGPVKVRTPQLTY